MLETVSQRELSIPGVPKIREFDPVEVLEAKQAWENWPSEHSAGDFVAVALVSQSPEIALEAARFLLRGGSMASAISKDLAQVLLTTPGQTKALPEASAEPTEFNARTIHTLRRTLRINVYDPYRWVELALAYTIIGKPLDAERALMTAHGLALNDRYVLRAITRFKLHEDRPEDALYILARSDRTPHDPWLLAAYLAAATLANKSPRFYKEAIQVSASTTFPDRDRSELLACLATMELNAGSDKHARRLFRSALVDPTENVMAQAFWATVQKKLRVGSTPDIAPTRNFETDTLKAMFSEDWTTSLSMAMSWQRDEPFSGRAAMVTSFLTGVAFDKYSEAEQLARIGLRANPGDLILLNNVAFFQASKGDLGPAALTIKMAMGIATKARSDVALAATAALTATAGLIAFRRGDVDDGRNLYQEAIRKAEKNKSEAQVALANIFLAREELLQKTDRAVSAFAIAASLMKKRWEPEVKLIFDRLKELAKKEFPK